jgi:hypothetical protein
MTRWERFKEDAKIIFAFALALGIGLGGIGYGIAKEVQWWKTSRALERRP